VDVVVGAKRSVVVGEGMGVTEGMGVSVDVGKEADMAVTVSMTAVSMDGILGVKFGLSLAAGRLHALSRNVVAAMKNNTKKFFLTRMVPPS
jgi:hypothetical protein